MIFSAETLQLILQYGGLGSHQVLGLPVAQFFIIRQVSQPAIPYHRYFQLGEVFLPHQEQLLPLESQKLVILLSGPRELPHWQPDDSSVMDYYDLKGLLENLLSGLREYNWKAPREPKHYNHLSGSLSIPVMNVWFYPRG